MAAPRARWLHWKGEGLDSPAFVVRLNGLPADEKASLLKLWLDYNRIERLPVELCALTQLASLNLSYNRLESLPVEIALLTNLHQLLLLHNQLRELPSSLGECTKLQSLNVYHNCLTRLPPTLTRLTALHWFTASSNAIPELEGIEIKKTATQSLLQLIGERFSYYGARNAAVTLMAMHRFRRAGTVWSAFGKDVIVYIIAPLLYETRHETVWHNADEAGYSQRIVSVAESGKPLIETRPY